MKILFIAADGRAGSQLALNEEFRAIQHTIRESRHGDAFEIVPEFAVRQRDLQRALLQHRPDIVHFACHGNHDAELVLLHDDGAAAPVAVGTLASYFRILRDNIALVVLNACFSSKQAEAIRGTIGLTIGMRQRITDAAAVRFSSAFYEGLAYGRSVRQAFELGVTTVGPPEGDVPELFERGAGRASTTCLVGALPAPPAARRFRAGARALAWSASIAGACGLVAVAWRAWPREPVPVMSAAASPGPLRASATVDHEAADVSGGMAPRSGARELALEVTPSLRGSRNGVLRTGDEIVSGDRIQVAIRPTVDAHVYVAFCDPLRRLSIFPGDGGAVAPAAAVTHLPSESAQIVLDDQIGAEVLYVVASRRPLALADPDLARALLRARAGVAAECGPPLEQVIQRGTQDLIEAGSAEQPELRAAPLASAAGPPGLAAVVESPWSAALLAGLPWPVSVLFEPRTAGGPAGPPRLEVSLASRRSGGAIPVRMRSRMPVSLERGAFIRWDAAGGVSAGGDRDDIVVLRYSFTHIAPR